MKKLSYFIRYTLAAMLLIFGLNKFFHFMSSPSLSDEAQAYLQAMESTGILFPLLGIIYILTAVALIVDRYAALMLLILTPITINILIFHGSLALGGIGPGLIVAILNALALFTYRMKYREILSEE
jgi:hypothetical protein